MTPDNRQLRSAVGEQEEPFPLCSMACGRNVVNQKKSMPGHLEMCESKAKQNNKKFIQAEIKPQLPHAVMSSLLNKMASYFRQIGILRIHWLQDLPALVPGSEQQ